MAEPKTSVIVPVYNSEKWLSRCVDSILVQTCGDFELLLVDDGSTDSSAALCDSYAARDARISVLHKANGGVSSARNAGIALSHGKFITFVDSDDWVEPDYLQCLLQSIGDADLAICDFQAEGTDEKWQQSIRPGLVLPEGFTDFAMATYPACHLTAPWIKLFRRSIIESHGLRFDSRLDTMEDTLFVLDYLRYVAMIACSDRRLYHYRRDGGGLSQDDGLLRRQMPRISAAVYSSLCRLAEVRDVEVSMLYFLIFGRRFYRWIFPRGFSAGQLAEHFKVFRDLPEIRCLHEGRFRIAKPKYGFIIGLIIEGRTTAAARWYRLMRALKMVR